MSSSSQNVDTKNKSNLQQPPAEEKIKSVLELLEEDDEFEVLNSTILRHIDLCKV
jgi:hypothetical protein